MLILSTVPTDVQSSISPNGQKQYHTFWSSYPKTKRR